MKPTLDGPKTQQNHNLKPKKKSKSKSKVSLPNVQNRDNVFKKFKKRKRKGNKQTNTFRTSKPKN